MKALLSLVLIVALVCTLTPSIYAGPTNQVMQGTQIRLTLLNGVSTAVAREGDPIVAVVGQPVFFGNQLLIPAGTRVNGVIGTIQKAKNFSLFKGQAYMNISFKTMEVDSRLIPVQMSIIGLAQPMMGDETKKRKDIKITEGEVLQEKHDYKGDAIGMAIGGGGGSLVGLIFSNALRGFGIGMAAGAIYVVARKGKELEMPAQTGMLVRLDTEIAVPSFSANSNGPNNASNVPTQANQ
ncbi:MAG: hypothetical protein WAK20_04380 [Candidatus Acidiferrum sp.]